MRPDLIDFLLKVCDAANIPGSCAELMVEAKYELKAMRKTGHAKSPFAVVEDPPAKVLGE